MRKLLVILSLGLLLTACRPTQPSTVSVGMRWESAKQVLEAHEWKNELVLFELEGDFAKKGGKMYQWQHWGDTSLIFSTLPKDGVETLSAIHPANTTSVGGELNVLSISAE